MDQVVCPIDPRKYSSMNISDFIKEYKVKIYKSEDENYFFSLDFLRTLYSKNKRMFFNLTVEFLLRGFKVDSKNSAMFFDPVPAPFHILVGKEINEEYVIPEILKPVLGYLNIQNNHFFEGIIIENFKSLLSQNYDFRILKNVFSNMGFEVLKIEDFKSRSYANSFERKKEKNVPLSFKNKLEKNSDFELQDDKKSAIPIERVISNPALLHFFYSKGIYKYNQITSEKLVEIKNTRGVGIKKWNNIIQDLEKVSENGIVSKKNDLELLVDHSINIPITDVLSNSYLIPYFHSNGIYNYNQITVIKLDKIKKMRGVGTKKWQNILDELKNIKNSFLIAKRYREKNRYRKIYPEIIGSKEKTRQLFSSAPKELQCILFNDDIQVITEKVKKLTDIYVEDIATDVYDSKKNYFLFLFNSQSLNFVEKIDDDFLNHFKINKEHLDFQKNFLKYCEVPTNNTDDEISSELLYVKKNFYLPDIFNSIKKEVVFEYKDENDCIDIIDSRLLSEHPLTLAELGKKHHVSRERIRQKEVKIKEFISKIISRYDINIAIENYFELEKNAFAFCNNLSSYKIWLIKLFNENVSSYEKVCFYSDSILLSRYYSEKTRRFLNKLDSIDVLSFEDLDSLLKKSFKDIDIKSNRIELLMHSLGFTKLENFFTRKKLTKKEIIYSYVIKRGKVRVNEVFLNEISNYYEKIVGQKLFSTTKLTDNIRNVQSILSSLVDEKKLILIDSGVYGSKDSLKQLPDEQVEEIKNFIGDRLECVPEINIKVVYAEFNSKIDVYSEAALYSFLKSRLNLSFDFGRHNTRTIRLKNTVKKTNPQVLEEYIKLKNGKATFNDVLCDMGWKKYTTASVVDSSSSLVKMNGDIFLNEKEITDDVWNFLRKKIKEQEDKHADYIITSKILDSLLIDRYDFYEDGKIPAFYLNNVDLFAKLLKQAVSDRNLKGNKILYVGNAAPSNELLLDAKFGDSIISIQQFIQFFNNIGYFNEGGIRKKKTEMEENRILFEIDENEFMLTKYVEVKQEDLILVDRYLDSLFKLNDDFVSLDACVVFDGLPKLDRKLRWNSFVLSYYVSFSTKYKNLSWNDGTYSLAMLPNDPHIVTTKDNETNNLITLIRDVLKKDYNGSMNEEDVAIYLSERNILTAKHKKLLPMYIMDNLFSVNEFGSLEYKDD